MCWKGYSGSSGHCGLGWGVAVAGGAAVACGGDIRCHSWPVDGRCGSGCHAADSLVGSVEGREAGGTEGGGDNQSVSMADHSVDDGEVGEDREVIADGWGGACGGYPAVHSLCRRITPGGVGHWRWRPGAAPS